MDNINNKDNKDNICPSNCCLCNYMKNMKIYRFKSHYISNTQINKFF